jgi:hypothetical protein
MSLRASTLKPVEGAQWLFRLALLESRLQRESSGVRNLSIFGLMDFPVRVHPPALMRGRVTIIFSTHHPEEAAAVCDEIMILKKGRVVAWGNPAEITARAAGHVFEASLSLQRLPLGTEWRLVSAERAGEYLHLHTVGNSPPDGRLEPPRLTDAYLLITSEPESND